MKRGGLPKEEIAHGKELLNAGAEDIWGWSTPAGKERVRRRVRWLIETCNIKPGVKVLECGCGTGNFTRHILTTGASITSVDISPDLLNEARRLCPSNNVEFVLVNLEEPIGLHKEEFDILCGVSVLHHLDLYKALVSLKPFLKPGAKFAFSEPNLMNPINRYIFSDNPDRRRKHGVSPSEMAFLPGELLAVFKEAGYKVDKINHRDFMHPIIPNTLIGPFKIIETFLELLPVVRRWSGSLWISGEVLQ